VRKFFISVLLISGIISGCQNNDQRNSDVLTHKHGAITRGDQTKKQISLVFTGGDYGDGGDHIIHVLKQNNIKGAFFFTGDRDHHSRLPGYHDKRQVHRHKI